MSKCLQLKDTKTKNLIDKLYFCTSPAGGYKGVCQDHLFW